MKITNPLAQSFYVEHKAGYFVTAVKLYFNSKDVQLPVTVQLRPMRFGIPTSEVYPFGEVVVDAKNILNSDDGSTPTRVVFPSPVYLLGEQFHCIALVTNSPDYGVWVAKIGQPDITYALQEESKQVIVTSQPLSGSLFKSQNGETWTAEQEEDLKFQVERAQFITPSGNVQFYNSILSKGNNQVATLSKDALEIDSRKLRLDLSGIVGGSSSEVTFGNTISQFGSNGNANYINSAGSLVNQLTIVNAGLGYTPSLGGLTFFDIPLSNINSEGKNATADITIQNGVAVGATIVNGGTGYAIGDVLTAQTIGNNSLGRNLRLSVSEIQGINELIVDQVQGNFSIGIGKSLEYTNNVGLTTYLKDSSDNILYIEDIDVVSDGLTIKVNHRNHGMHSPENIVSISEVNPDVRPVLLNSAYPLNSTNPISLNTLPVNSLTGISEFSVFEGVGVGSTNPGYVLIGDEIIRYQGVSGSSLINITRSIDNTKSSTYPSGTPVYKYELGGISLRRINKTHTLQDVNDNLVQNRIDLDHYHIKINTSSEGTNRDGGSLPDLFLNSTKSCGGTEITASQNIPYEIVRPAIETMVLNGTSITASIRSSSGRSVSGNEESFLIKPSQVLNLDENNYFKSPNIVCSRINETTFFDPNQVEGSRSLNVSLDLATSDGYISPVVDLEKTSMIFTSNRINKPIDDYKSDDRTSSLEKDPSAFVYATNPISIENPATSIKIVVGAYINIYSDLRAFYALLSDPQESPIYYPFPGYLNRTNLGEVLDFSESDGTPDTNVPKTDIIGFDSNELIFKDYEFTVTGIPEFRYFSVKLVGSSTNQTHPVRLRDLRVIALA
mgnify:CR=1 FL=1|jgi:hypothetical protein